MFVVLYRWRLIAGREEEFCEAWSEVTLFYRENYDSLGSRLHRGSDGLWYGYAKWKSRADRENASAERNVAEASERMSAAILERFPPVELEVVEDFWLNP